MFKILIFFLISVNFSKSSEISNLNVKSDFLKDLLVNGISQNYSSARQLEESAICLHQINEIIGKITSNRDIFKVFDSWGKIPSGIAWGHLTELGNYDECVKTTIKLDETNVIKTQYCQANIPLDTSEEQSSKTWARLKMPEIRATENREISFSKPVLTIGICLPRSCHPKTVTGLLNAALSEASSAITNISIPQASCSSEDTVHMEGVDYAAFAILGTVGAIMVLSTIYDYISKLQRVVPKPILVTFSILSSGKKLLQISSSKSMNSVDCLHGIRVFSMVWVIFGHTHIFYPVLPLINSTELMDWLSQSYSMLVLTATVSVDSFFFLSGFLVAWLGFKELKRTNGKLNIPMMYFHRVLRLTPVLAMAVLFSASLFRFLGSGPYWSAFVEGLRSPCRSNWWSTLFYIQNYEHSENICLGHTWYLAVDTQLFIISPLILIPLWKWGKKFAAVMVTLSLASIGYVIGMHFHKKWSNVLLGEIDVDRMRLTYYPTHTRYSPWLVGIGLGYYLFLNKDRKIQVPKPLVCLGWIVSFTIIFSIIFGPLHTTQPGYRGNVLEAAMYESLSRVSWSIALAWIVFACHNGYGGPINDFLSYSLWQTLGRLTYSMYITHVFVLMRNFGSYRTDIHFSNYEVSLQFWGAFGVTTLVSVICVLAFESPIIAIERIIFNRKTVDGTTTNSREHLVRN